MPILRRFKKRMIFWISSTAIGSTPEKGSSSRMNLGFVASARAISTRRRSPPDNDSAMCSFKCAICNSFINAWVRAAMAFAGKGTPRASLNRQHAHGMAVERNLAGIERDQPDHHIKGGGFAGAVRTQQSDNLAA